MFRLLPLWICVLPFVGLSKSVNNEINILEKEKHRVKLRWKIAIADAPIRYNIESPTFLVGNVPLYLQIAKTESDTLCFLWKRDSKTEHLAFFELGITNGNGPWLFKSMHRDLLLPKKESLLLAFFLDPEIFDFKYVATPSGDFTLFFEGKLGSTKENVWTLSQNLKDLLASGRQSDMKIVLRGKEFLVHKLIISVRCPVMYSMLETKMSKKSHILSIDEDCDDIIIIDDDYDVKTFEHFLLFLYSGLLDKVSLSDCETLYFLADKYEVDGLKKACSEHLDTQISIDNIADVVRFAGKHDDSDLLDSSALFLFMHLDTAMQLPEVKSVLKDYPKVAAKVYGMLKNSKKN